MLLTDSLIKKKYIYICLTFDLDLHNIISILETLLHLTAVKTSVVLPHALKTQGEVSGGVGIVEQRGPFLVGLTDPHSVTTGHQDLCLHAMIQDTPFNPGDRQHSVATIGRGGWRRVCQRHQAG